MRRFLSGLCTVGAVAGVATASEPAKPVAVAPFFCPPVPVNPLCPPGTAAPGLPTMPGFPSTPPVVPITPDTGSPGTPPTPDLTGTAPTPGGLPPAATGALGATAADTQFARGTERGGGGYSQYYSSMMGDLIGARSLRIGYNARLSATFNSLGGTTLGDGSAGVTVAPNPQGLLSFVDSTGRSRQVNVSSFAGNANLNYVQALGAGGTLDTFFAQQALQTLLSTGNLTADQIAQFNRLTPAQRQQILDNRGRINAGLARVLNGLTIPNVRVTNVAGTAGDAVSYTADLESETIVALPGSSSAVGRVKMSEDNSPMPRDRLIFVYDSFGAVPFTPDGIGVNRFQFGVEKTFLDGVWSAEFRLPFAGTLASTTVQGFETTGVELGNVRLALKRLWTRSDRLNIATGLGVTLPTAKDQVVLAADGRGTELYRFMNESVQLEPFIAALFTPNDRLFAQAWTAVNFDASGGDLTWNRDVFGGSGSARIWDLPVLALDGQIGYWLVRNTTGPVRGLAPFLELHYNRVLGQRLLIDEVRDSAAGQGLTITGIGNQEFNLTAGVLCQLGDNLNLTIGGSAPLLQRPDRTFDWQFGIRMNYFFGYTARQRALASQVSGF